MSRIGSALLFLVFITALAGTVFAVPTRNDFEYRMRINATNNEPVDFYRLPMELNLTTSNMQQDGVDLAMFCGSTLQTGTSVKKYSSTLFGVRFPIRIAAGSYNDSCYLYYGSSESLTNLSVDWEVGRWSQWYNFTEMTNASLSNIAYGTANWSIKPATNLVGQNSLQSSSNVSAFVLKDIRSIQRRQFVFYGYNTTPMTCSLYGRKCTALFIHKPTTSPNYYGNYVSGTPGEGISINGNANLFWSSGTLGSHTAMDAWQKFVLTLNYSADDAADALKGVNTYLNGSAVPSSGFSYGATSILVFNDSNPYTAFAPTPGAEYLGLMAREFSGNSTVANLTEEEYVPEATTSFSYDFTSCTLPGGVTYDYGSQSANWRCNNTDTGGRYYAAMPWSQDQGTVNNRNPETHPMMYIEPTNPYQNFNVTFTVAAYRNVYLGGSGSFESEFHNKGTMKIYAFDSSHSEGDMAYWEISIVPGNRYGGAQHLTFNTRWVYSNQTVYSAASDNSPNNAFLCDGSCTGSPPNRWINVRMERIGTTYKVSWKYQYNTTWSEIANFNSSDASPLYGFDKIGFSNYNSTRPCQIGACDLGRYPWSYGAFLDNITGNLAIYTPIGNGTHRVEGYIRSDINNNGVIEGSDYDVADINVTLIDFENTMSVSNQTDSNGYFFFSGLENGNYYVSTQVISDPSNLGETALYYEAFTPTVTVGSSYDYTTTLGDGRGYWRSLNGDVKMYLNTIQTGTAKVTVRNDAGSPVSGVKISNQYKSGSAYVSNGGYCLTDGSGICYLPLYSTLASPTYQEYQLIATKGALTNVVPGVRVSKNLLTNVAITLNSTQRYYIVPADVARANDFGEVSFTPDPLLVNQYIDDIYFKVWDAFENRYFSEAVDGLIADSTVTIDSEPFYLQREGSAFCLNYVENPSIETCYVHYRHAGGNAYLVNISLTMPNNDPVTANIVEYPSFSVMREGRKLMTAFNASHANISVEMLDDYTQTSLIDLAVPNFGCTWESGSMGEWDTYVSRIVPYSGNSVSGTLHCTADNYSVFDRETVFYLGDDAVEAVECAINGGRVFPPTAEVPVSCIVESPLFCSQAGLKNSMAVKINRAAQGAYDSWYGLTLVGDDPNSDKMICEGGSCCNPRILFSAEDVLFRSQTGLSQDAWEFFPEGTHYMDVLVNDSTSTLAPYFGAFLFTLDKTAPSTTPELMSVDIPYDILDSTMNFTCNLTYTNPQKQIQGMLIQITKVVNALDLDSPENTVITSSIPSWYLDDQPVQGTYVFPVIYSIVSCDSTSLTCTYRGVTEQFTETTFSIKDGQDIICKASIQLKSGSTYEQEQQDSVEFKYMGAGLTDGAVNFATGILNDPYAFLLLAIVVALLMPIILILVRYLFV